ncbi:MAG: acyl-CoA thioesterase [Bacteroidota bacterium]
MKTPESTHLIRFPDCDPFNHLNNSKYIDYFINAREDHLANNHEFVIHTYATETGKSWVVGLNQIAYFVPAVLMEKVIIQSTVLEFNTSDILVEMRMWDEHKRRLKSILWTRFVHVDIKESKRINHDQTLMDQFTPIINALEQQVSFEQRVVDIRRKKFEEM